MRTEEEVREAHRFIVNAWNCGEIDNADESAQRTLARISEVLAWFLGAETNFAQVIEAGRKVEDDYALSEEILR